MNNNSNNGPKGLDTLDKVEQTITLTLQEIDQNIAACHKMTLSIYSLLNQYNNIRRQMLLANSHWFLFFNLLQPGQENNAETVVEEELPAQNEERYIGDDSMTSNSVVRTPATAKKGGVNLLKKAITNNNVNDTLTITPKSQSSFNDQSWIAQSVKRMGMLAVDDAADNNGILDKSIMCDSPILKLSDRTYSLFNQLKDSEINSSFESSFQQ